MVNQKICKKKYLSWVYGVDRKSVTRVTDRHHDRFFTLTSNLHKSDGTREGVSALLPIMALFSFKRPD